MPGGSAAIDASRISSHMPARMRSRPSSAVSASWSEEMPARCVRLEREADEARRVTVHVRDAVERELLELSRVAVHDPGEVHHLGQPEHAAAAHQPFEVARDAAASSATRTWEAGTHDGAMQKMSSSQTRGDVQQPVDAVDAEHVRDLVRVGHDRRRPERQDQPRQLVDHQLHRLDVHVGVDEAGDDVPACRVERLATRSTSPTPATHPSTIATSRLEPLPGEGGKHAAAPDHEVGGVRPRGRPRAGAARSGPGHDRLREPIRGRSSGDRCPAGTLRRRPASDVSYSRRRLRSARTDAGEGE